MCASKKRIVVFCGGSHVSGAEIVTLAFMKELMALGHPILCIVNGWNDGVFKRKLAESNIPFSEVKLGFIYISQWRWTLDTLVHYPGALRKIRKVFSEFKPDVTWHVSPRTMLMLYPLIKLRKNIVIIHDPQYGNMSRRFFSILRNLIHKCIAVSQALKENLVQIGAQEPKLTVIHNGMDISFFPKNPESITNPIRFGIIGQIIPRKGHQTVIDALKILKEKSLEFKCIIIGSGDQCFVENLKAQVRNYNLQDRIEWKGFVENRDEIYEAFDVALVPSNAFDPLPTTAIEAGFYYKPAIVSNMGGLPEIIVDGQTGFIVEANNAPQLAEKMERFIRDTDQISTMGAQSRAHVAKNFDIKLKAQQLLEVINNL